MENNFICPYCKGQLGVGDSIIFRVINESGTAGLLLLHAEIGNYESFKNKNFEIGMGEKLEFFCPICHHGLSSDLGENLVYVLMEEASGEDYDLYFSRIMGEQSTFQVAGDTVKASGEHFSRYTYFRMSNKYKNFLEM